MQIDLTPFFSPRGVLFDSNGAELAVAKAFASAANASNGTHQHITELQPVPVEFQLRLKQHHKPQPLSWDRSVKDVVLRCVDRAMGRVYPPLDVLQYISSDSPTFAGSEAAADHHEDGALTVVFHVRPSAALVPLSLMKPHAVEGEAVAGVALPEPADAAALTAAASETMKDTLSDMDLWYRARAAHQQYDASIPLDSLQQLTGSLLHLEGDAGASDVNGAQRHAQQQQQQAEKLAQLQWQLSRWLAELFLNEGGWARPHGSSSTSAKQTNSGSSAEAAARRLFHAPLKPAFPHVVDAALFAHPSPADKTADGGDAAVSLRRQLHADVRGMEWDGLLLGCTARYAYVAVPYFVSAAETTMRVAQTGSTGFSAGDAACVWSLVCRVPIPAFARKQDDATRGDNKKGDVASSAPSSDGPATRKRSRVQPQDDEAANVAELASVSSSSAATAASATTPTPTPTLAQLVLSRCFNVEEVTRHDTNAAALFRLMETPYIVTVRAHRVYCARADPAKQPAPPQHAARTASASLCAKKPHPAASPYKLSMVLEDAYVVSHRAAEVASTDVSSPAMTTQHWAAALFGIDSSNSHTSNTVTASSASSSALARALHTFPDVVSVVRESCHRFVRSHERFCSLYSRSLEATKKLTSAAKHSLPLPVPSETSAEAVNGEGETLAEKESTKHEELLDAAVSGNVAETPSKLAHPSVTADASGERKDLPTPAVAAQQLRLLRQTEVVYSSIADSMSVHYKKLRGAARVAIPVVRTTADVASLEESNNVEFKAKVGLSASAAGTATAAVSAEAGQGRSGSRHGGRQAASTMDTERLRNTMAAMAACRGGVILIGVADDGRVIGHAKQLEVARQLRLSGFCPAMVKDAVQVRELRWLDGTGGGAAAAQGSSAIHDGLPAKRAMPENWWKAGGGNSSTQKQTDVGQTKAGAKGTPAGQKSTSQLVVTVISVEKGQAPFYATAKNTPPYQRGCASTVVMPTVVLAKRLMKELA